MSGITIPLVVGALTALPFLLLYWVGRFVSRRRVGAALRQPRPLQPGTVEEWAARGWLEPEAAGLLPGALAPLDDLTAAPLPLPLDGARLAAEGDGPDLLIALAALRGARPRFTHPLAPRADRPTAMLADLSTRVGSDVGGRIGAGIGAVLG